MQPSVHLFIGLQLLWIFGHILFTSVIENDRKMAKSLVSLNRVNHSWGAHSFICRLLCNLAWMLSGKYGQNISSHLISSHLISSHLISSCLILSHLISSHLISFHLISSILFFSHLFSWNNQDTLDLQSMQTCHCACGSKIGSKVLPSEDLLMNKSNLTVIDPHYTLGYQEFLHPLGHRKWCYFQGRSHLRQ